jgi:hypothetical protein
MRGADLKCFTRPVQRRPGGRRLALCGAFRPPRDVPRYYLSRQRRLPRGLSRPGHALPQPLEADLSPPHWPRRVAYQLTVWRVLSAPTWLLRPGWVACRLTARWSVTSMMSSVASIVQLSVSVQATVRTAEPQGRSGTRSACTPWHPRGSFRRNRGTSSLPFPPRRAQRIHPRRRRAGSEDDLTYELGVLRDTARQSSQQVWVTMETIREQLEELPAALDSADMLQKLGHDVWSNRLFPAYDALMGLVSLTEELLRREQGRRGLSQEALMELLVRPPEQKRSFEELKVLLQRLQQESGDEAQS